MEMQLTYDKLPLVVEFDYDPGEPPVLWGNHPHPGSACAVSIYGCRLAGHDIVDLLPDSTVRHLETLVLEQLDD